MDDDLTNVDPDLIPVLGAWLGPRDPVGAARHCNVTRLWVPDGDVKLGLQHSDILTGQSSGRL